MIAGLLLLVVGIPSLLRSWTVSGRRGQPLKLVILSPHHEEIRYEFGEGFSEWHQRRYGRPVEVDWRNVGNTGQISRYLTSQYEVAFDRFYRQRHQGAAIPVSDWVDPSRQPAGPKRELAEQVRAELLAPENARVLGIRVDLVFGGGAFDHERFRRYGYSVPCRVDPETLRGVPQRWAGIDYYYIEERPGERRRDSGFDPRQDWRDEADGYWYGTALSGFGIVYNREVLRRLGLPAPMHWADLADPRYAGWIGLADPRHSGATNYGFEMILQTQMAARLKEAEVKAQQAVAQAQRLQPVGLVRSRGGVDPEALERGWRDGLNLIKRLGANARFFTESSTRVPVDVAARNAAAGMAIDFYGRFQTEFIGGEELGYVSPPGGTTITPDPISLLRGAPDREVAIRFIHYVLSVDGQMLWDLPAGFVDEQSGRRGPRRYTTRRMSIRPEVYQLYGPYLKNQENPFEPSAALLDYRPKYTQRLFGLLRMLVGAMCIETHEELKRAWGAVHGQGSGIGGQRSGAWNPGQAPEDREAREHFDWLPVTHREATLLAGANDKDIRALYPGWSPSDAEKALRGAIDDPRQRDELALEWLRGFRHHYAQAARRGR